MLIAHIGRGKCGSTSLQFALHDQRCQLMEQGIFVPETTAAHPGHHGAIWRELAEGHDTPPALGELANALRDASFNRVVISSEFFLSLPPEGIRTLVDATPQGSLRAIVYLRDYANWLLSAYAQGARKGRLSQEKSFDWFYQHMMDSVSVTTWLRAWAGCIGGTNLSIRQLQDGLVQGRSISEDFGLQICGTLHQVESRNISPHWWAIECRRALSNIVASPQGTVRSEIACAMGLLDAAGCASGTSQIGYLTLEQFERLNCLYSSDIEAVGKIATCDEDARFSRAPLLRQGTEPPNVRMIPAEVLTEVAAACATKFGQYSQVARAIESLMDSSHPTSSCAD